jgi:UPF0755 protein
LKTRQSYYYFVLGTMGLVCILSCLTICDFWLFLRLPGSSDRTVREVMIRPGMNVTAVAQLLHQQRVISDTRKFYYLCRYRQAGQKLKAGEYDFSPFSTPEQVLERIVAGRVALHRVTVPEGFTVRDVARTLNERGLASESTILQHAVDPNWIRSLGLESTSIEGYLFPDTYHFNRSQNAEAILKTMVSQFLRRLPPGWQDRSQELGMTLHEIVTMASLVEKEAMVDAERARIAGVFFNRLARGMPLQSDPTAVYDLENFSGPILWNHLKRESPYNTYRNKGLPLGPICNPGSKSIQAVLHAEKVPYLYFVSNNDGTHSFSENLQEHAQAVSRYRALRKAAASQEEAPSGGVASSGPGKHSTVQSTP